MKQVIINIILENLLPLQVILPITLALILIFFKKAKFSIFLVQTYLLISLIISILMFITIYISDVQYITYIFGNFNPIIGIKYKINKVISLMVLITSFIVTFGYFWGKRLLNNEIGLNKIYLFNILYLIFYSGLLGIILTNDLFNIFIFTEISSIASYAIIGMNRTNKSSPFTAFNYLIIGSIATSLYVLGVGILYTITGSLNIDIVSQKILSTNNNFSLVLALILIIIFVIIKIGIVPFSSWVPKVYNDVPFTFNPAVAGISSKVILYSFMKIVLMFFPAIGTDKVNILIPALNFLASITIIFGGIIAIFQKDLKQILAWSSVSYIGYIFLIIFEDNKTTITAVLLLIIWHSITKSGLFMVAGNIKYLLGNTKLDCIGSFYKQSTLTFAIFILLSLSLIGFPGTLGFTVKWYLVTSLLHFDLIFSAILIIISSVISIFYVWKVIENAIFNEPSNLNITSKAIPLHMNIILVFLTLISVILGLLGNNFIIFLYEMVSSTINNF